MSVLDLATFAISSVQTSGAPPGWIHGHTAALSEDGNSILIRRGKLDRRVKNASLIENIEDWRLSLVDWRWEQLTDRRWPRWEIRRKHGEVNHLFGYQQALLVKQFPEIGRAGGELSRVREISEIPSLDEELGRTPDLDLYARRYQPGMPHDEVPATGDEYDVHRSRVAGVMVRYVEDLGAIQMTVEGQLPQQTMDSLTHDLLDKLSTLENAPCEMTRL